MPVGYLGLIVFSLVAMVAFPAYGTLVGTVLSYGVTGVFVYGLWKFLHRY